MLHRELETERERPREREPELARSLSLRICSQSPCLAHKALARLRAVLLRYSTLSWCAVGGVLILKLGPYLLFRVPIFRV